MKNKTTIIILSIIIVLFSALIITGTIATETDKKPIVADKLAEQDYGYLFDFYIKRTPNIENRPFYGEETGSITLILYTDIISEGAQTFNKKILERLKNEFIHTGKAKLYHKYYLTAEDVEQQTERYYYAQALACYNKLQPNTFFDFYFKLYETTLTDVPELAESQGIERKTFMNCIKTETFKELKEDRAEIEQYGLVGLTPWLYVGIEGKELVSYPGIPNYNNLYLRIRNYQTVYGE